MLVLVMVIRNPLMTVSILTTIFKEKKQTKLDLSSVTLVALIVLHRDFILLLKWFSLKPVWNKITTNTRHVCSYAMHFLVVIRNSIMTYNHFDNVFEEGKMDLSSVLYILSRGVIHRDLMYWNGFFSLKTCMKPNYNQYLTCFYLTYVNAFLVVIRNTKMTFNHF